MHMCAHIHIYIFPLSQRSGTVTAYKQSYKFTHLFLCWQRPLLQLSLSQQTTPTRRCRRRRRQQSPSKWMVHCSCYMAAAAVGVTVAAAAVAKEM